MKPIFRKVSQAAVNSVETLTNNDNNNNGNNDSNARKKTRKQGQVTAGLSIFMK